MENGKFVGYGIHHNALGVKDLTTMRAFYRDVLGFDTIFVDFPLAEYPALDDITRFPHTKYQAVLFNQKAGGIILELMQMHQPLGRPIRKDFKYGDLGQAKITIVVPDVELTYKELKGKANFCSRPKSVTIAGFGDYHFVYLRDPENSMVELVSAAKLPVKSKFGGMQWVGVSVTNLDRSIAFYQKILGMDIMFISKHDKFSGLVDELSGAEQTKVRSCVLGSSKGPNMIELFEVLEPRGRSIPFATRWGDYGFAQICFSGKQGVDISEIAAHYEKQGIEFMCEPKWMHDERDGAFFYMKDPDGVPIEFLVFLK